MFSVSRDNGKINSIYISGDEVKSLFNSLIYMHDAFMELKGIRLDEKQNKVFWALMKERELQYDMGL